MLSNEISDLKKWMDEHQTEDEWSISFDAEMTDEDAMDENPQEWYNLCNFRNCVSFPADEVKTADDLVSFMKNKLAFFLITPDELSSIQECVAKFKGMKKSKDR